MQQKAAAQSMIGNVNTHIHRCRWQMRLHSQTQRPKRHGRQYGWYADGYGNGSDDGPDDERQYYAE